MTDFPVHVAAWEHEFEHSGPIVEAVGIEAASSPIWAEPLKGCYPYLDSAWQSWQGKDTVIDMGGDVERGRIVPNAVVWTTERGHDMRHLTSVFDQWADLIFASHSIEHIPSADVPDMLLAWIRALRPGGEMYISGPHRCSHHWSPILNPAVRDVHLWAPTAACIGNYLIAQGMRLLAVDTCITERHMWYVWQRKP
jgi:hypothetical protein